MRVLFTLLPGTGSLHPLVPIARALIDAGHEVRFACAPSFEPAVREHGFDTHPAGVDFLFSQPDYFPVLVAHAGVAMPDITHLTGHARHAWGTENLFIRAVGKGMLPDILVLARTWRPHLIVRDSSEFSGCVAAEALDIPTPPRPPPRTLRLIGVTSPPPLSNPCVVPPGCRPIRMRT